jgi:hypothetical protein
MSQLSVEQTHESIRPFQNWIDRIEINAVQPNRNGRVQSKSFTNGPYAEIKELIGKFQPVLGCFEKK